MEKTEAEKFGLFRDYEFELHFGTPVEVKAVLLIPEEGGYKAKEFLEMELRLVPYLQKYFNNQKPIKVENLYDELREENNFLIHRLSDGSTYLIQTLNRFLKYSIVSKKADLESIAQILTSSKSIGIEDTIVKGENYDHTKVFNVFPPLEMIRSNH